MADAGPGLDAGYLCVLHAASDEARASAGDQQVHQAGGFHQLAGAFPVRILHESHQLGRQERILQTEMYGPDNGGVGSEGLFASAKDHRVPGFQRQRRGVGGHVRPALVNDGDDPQGHSGLLDDHAVGPLRPLEHLPHRIRQPHHVQDALCHARDPLRREPQPVDHYRAESVL